MFQRQVARLAVAALSQPAHAHYLGALNQTRYIVLDESEPEINEGRRCRCCNNSANN